MSQKNANCLIFKPSSTCYSASFTSSWNQEQQDRSYAQKVSVLLSSRRHSSRSMLVDQCPKQSILNSLSANLASSICLGCTLQRQLKDIIAAYNMIIYVGIKLNFAIILNPGNFSVHLHWDAIKAFEVFSYNSNYRLADGLEGKFATFTGRLFTQV